MESSTKWITLDLAIGEKVHIGNTIATVLDIDGDQVTVIIEQIDYDDSDLLEDAELLAS